MSKTSKVQQAHKTIHSGLDRYQFALILISGVFFVFSSLMEMFRLSVFDPNRDTVIFNQAFWNTIHYGELLYNSPEATSHFGVHFSPIFFSVLPVYFLAPGPETLFILQSALVTLGVIPIYLCAREFLGPKIGSIVAITYFFYPNLHGIAYFDFYETTFLPVILGFALWGYMTGRKNLMLISCCAALLVKEDVSLIILMISIVGLWSERARPIRENWRYILLILLSITILLSFFLVIKPVYSNGDPNAANQFLDQYRNIPDNLSDNNGKRIYYLVQLFTPLLYVPFAAPSILVIAIPSLLEILLSPSSMYHFVGQHYTAPLIPIIFMSLIIGLKKIKTTNITRGNSIIKGLPYIILLCTIISALFWSPYVPPLQYVLENKQIETWNHGPSLHKIFAIIPEDVPLAAPIHILPFLTNRHDLYSNFNQDAEIILFDTHLPEFSEDFQKNMEVIERNYTQTSRDEGIFLYIRNDKTQMIQEMNHKMNI